MNSDLNSLVLKKEYRSLEDNVVQEFYIPTLYRAISYKRAVGFFSSSALIEISKGICQLAKNGGRIQLVASPYLSKEDIEAIRKGYETRRQVIESALLRELDDEHLDYYASERLNFLANLIAQGILDIKIAVTENRCTVGMYHEKMGIIADDNGNCIAFSGSMNESSTALSVNYETIDVYCSWNGFDEENRVGLKKKA